MEQVMMQVIWKPVQAEHVRESVDGAMTWFDYPCPNCSRRHGAQEETIGRSITRVGYANDCGHVMVIFPWADQPAQEPK